MYFSVCIDLNSDEIDISREISVVLCHKKRM